MGSLQHWSNRVKVLALNRGQSCEGEVDGTPMWTGRPTSEVAGVGAGSQSDFRNSTRSALCIGAAVLTPRETRDDFGPILLSVAP
jgi:hypothetical protein